MTLTYSEIFAERGSLYHAAMVRFPQARDTEFDALFRERPLVSGEHVLDVPAGGGYLARRVPPGVAVTGFELTEGFGAGMPLYPPTGSWQHGRFDRAVCLAALHHMDDPLAFLASLSSRLVPGGLLHVADVLQGSPLTRFLDEFVGRYNTTGHEGRYLDPDAPTWQSLGCVLRMREDPCPWRFPHIDGLLDFCAALFGLVDCPPAALHEALARHVGITEDERGVALQWRLAYVDIQVGSA